MTTKTPSPQPAPGSTADLIAPLLDAGLASLDLGPESAALAAIKSEIVSVQEAQDNAEKEAGEVRARLDKKRLGRPGDQAADATAAAETYLTGGSSEEIETETSLQSRSEALRSIRTGLRQRLDGLYNRRRAAEGDLERKLATAGVDAATTLQDELTRRLQAVQEIADVAKVLTAAIRGCRGVHVRAEAAVSAANGERGREEEPIRPAGETPAWLLAVLKKHEEKIRAGRGSVLAHVTPPRRPPEESEARPARDEDYEPGLGGSAALRGGFGGGATGVVSIPTTNL